MIKTYPKLYKMDSTGSIRVWWITAELNDMGRGVYTQHHGLLDGAIVTKETIVKSGKNIGKANETTVWDQTCAEAQSKWSKQVERKGYTESIPTEKPFRPMLAHQYKDHKHKVKFPWMAQAKLNGIRCIAKITADGVELTSRTGKPFTCLQHIKDALSPLCNRVGMSELPIIFDGELYNHDYRDSLQTIASAVNRDEPNELTLKIQYWIFDKIDEYTPFEERANQYWLDCYTLDDVVVDLAYGWVSNDDGLEELYKHVLKNGFEGLILRNPQGLYKMNGRSADLLKYKPVYDAEFEIVGAHENDHMPGTCAFVCKMPNSEATFKVVPKGTENQRRKYWRDFKKGLLTGKMLTVEYRGMTTTEPPVPFHGVGICVRDYE